MCALLHGSSLGLQGLGSEGRPAQKYDSFASDFEGSKMEKYRKKLAKNTMKLARAKYMLAVAETLTTQGRDAQVCSLLYGHSSSNACC